MPLPAASWRWPMRALDLYSGVGGLSLGMTMAGIEMVGAYDCWPLANNTYERNLRAKPTAVDLRAFAPRRFSSGVEIIVGSPPCTRFSYSNRGGNGDISDGLTDIRMFLEAVARLRPRFW